MCCRRRQWSAIVLIASAVVAASQGKIAESGLLIMAVVILHNSFGLLRGYSTGKVVKLPLAQRESLALKSVSKIQDRALLATWIRRMQDDREAAEQPRESAQASS